MPINNELIEGILLKLSKRKAVLAKENHEIQGYTFSLQSIMTTDDSILPKDELTGDEMSKERRDEIFNSVAKKAQKYLGGNE